MTLSISAKIFLVEKDDFYAACLAALEVAGRHWKDDNAFYLHTISGDDDIDRVLLRDAKILRNIPQDNVEVICFGFRKEDVAYGEFMQKKGYDFHPIKHVQSKGELTDVPHIKELEVMWASREDTEDFVFQAAEALRKWQ